MHHQLASSFEVGLRFIQTKNFLLDWGTYLKHFFMSVHVRFGFFIS